MNFKLTHSLPEKCLVAVSGGVDSISALHFLRRRPGRVAGIVHFNHKSGEFSDLSERHVKEVFRDCPDVEQFELQRLNETCPKDTSLEDWWRAKRYTFFDRVSRENGDLPIVLAHNMDDCLEEYIMCTMIRGFSGTIPYAHSFRCIRPFRLWKRHDIVQYAKQHGLGWIEDPSNNDYVKFKRAMIRRHVAPKIKHLNPGIYKIVEKIIREQDIRDKPVELSSEAWKARLSDPDRRRVLHDVGIKES